MAAFGLGAPGLGTVPAVVLWELEGVLEKTSFCRGGARLCGANSLFGFPGTSWRGRPPLGRWHGEKTPEAPDYFTPEETSALVAANPIYPVRMAMRIMLRTWLRVSECLSLCPADPPIISLRPEVTGNKVKRGREVHIPDDLVECLEDLVL